MADRYDERYRPDYGRERNYGEDRGMMDRAGDEVRSWFGDDEAARRRERDEREPDRGRDYSRGYEAERAPRRFAERPYGREGIGSRPGEFTWRESGREYGRGSAISGGGFGASYGSAMDYTTGREHDTGMSRGATGMYGRTGAGRNHTGRGPKGYRRSDDRIREDVCDRLTDDPQIDASDIEVAVINAEVTLTGMAREREDKRRAEDIAESISGVREVHNSLRLKRDDDTSMTAAAAASTGRTGKQADR